MNVRKNWFSYILWAVSVLLGLFAFIPISDRIIVVDYNSIYIAYLIKVVVLLIPVLLEIVLYNFFKEKEIFKFRNRFLFKILFNSLSAIILLSIFLFLRYYYLVYLETPISNIEFFETVKIASTESTKGFVSVINEGFYQYLASFVLMIFGNKVEILIYLQLILQLITTIAIYIASSLIFRGHFGIIPAIMLCINPSYIGKMFDISDSNYNIMFFSFVILGFALTVRNVKHLSIKVCVFSAITGFLMFYHLNFLGFLLMAAVICSEFQQLNIQKKILNSFLCVIFGIFSFTITYFAHYLTDFDIILSIFRKFEIIVIDSGSQYHLYFHFLFLLIFLSYIASFWFSKFEIGHIFVINIIAELVYLLFIENNSYYIEALILIEIMMTFMISDSFRLILSADISQDDKIEAVIVDDPKTKNKSNIKSIENAKNDEFKSICINSVNNSQKSDLSENTNWQEIKNDLDEVKRTRRRPERRIDKRAPIENVLPMPKKHVKRTLDYNYELSEEDMHYDLDLNENNSDYDV